MNTYFLRRQAKCLVASLLLFSALLTSLRAEEAGPFVDTTFAEAKTLAAKDGKVIFVDFFTTWCPPCKMLDSTTWKDADVVALLREKTVALKIDAEKQRDLAKSYLVDAYPTLLVLKADGTELDRYVGYMPAKDFFAALTATLAGKTSLQQAREQVSAKDVATPKSRMALAKKLVQAGQFAEALEQYLWCYDSGPDADTSFARIVNSSLPGSIGALGRKYPPALDALRARRDTLREKVLADPQSAETSAVERLASLDLALRDDEGLVSTLAKLPEGRVRKSYGGMPVLMRLVEKKHYREALSLGSPEAAYQEQVDQANQAVEMMKASGRAMPPGMEDSFKKMRTMTGMVYVIALAGASETERATQLAKKIMTESSDPSVRKGLADGLRESGLTEFANTLFPDAAVPTSSQ